MVVRVDRHRGMRTVCVDVYDYVANLAKKIKHTITSSTSGSGTAYQGWPYYILS